SDMLREALQIDPRFAAAQADLIEIEIRAGHGDAAGRMAADFRDNASKSGEKNATGDLLVGETAIRLGRFRDAADAFDAAMQKEPSGDVAVRWANARFRAGDRRGGAKVLEDWIKLHPDELKPRQ